MLSGAPDLSTCDREPIHIPGSIQPHGLLLVLDGERRVLQASGNAAALLEAPRVVGARLADLLGAEIAAALDAPLAAAPAASRPALLGSVATAGRRFHAVAHQAAGGTVLELELAGGGAELDLPLAIDAFTHRAEAALSIDDLCQVAAEEVRRLTGFDRVLVYRFDDDQSGTVVGEDGSGRLPSYLHHRFPGSDIPAQARELYRQNRIRIIPDAGYQPVPVTPAESPTTGAPLDMSYAALRSVSPVHLEYMKNMGTAASMSVSILRAGALWGLVSCHHAEPKLVPFPVRAACDLLARAFSLRLSGLARARDYERRIEVEEACSALTAAMTDRSDYAAALADHPDELLAVAGAEGAMVLTHDDCRAIGRTPGEGEARTLAAWLFETADDDVYATESLSAEFPAAAGLAERASGLLAVAISELHPSYVLWFRPEVIQTIEWGGDPNKPTASNGDPGTLHPRRSFDTWKETVRRRSTAWKSSEVDGARRLRSTIVGSVLRRAEELAALNSELTRSNEELEAFAYSVSHDLRAPLRHVVGYAELLRESVADELDARARRYIDTIIDSSRYAGQLMDRLLSFSRLGRAHLDPVRVDMAALVREVQADVMRDAAGRTVTWRIGELPAVKGDIMMLRMAVRALLDNALKYSRNEPEAIIEVGCSEKDGERVFSVADNGVGFDMSYADKLFGVFQRLHRWEDYEGTGIGLANVRRVIERHGGRTWAEGAEGRGATFHFSLPIAPA